MSIKYTRMDKIDGPLIFLRTKHASMNGEIVSIKGPNNEILNGRVLKVYQDIACIEVFEGTKGLDVNKTEVTFLDELFKIEVSLDMRGKTFNGQGRLIRTEESKDTPDLFPDDIRDINGFPINPNARQYPKDIIQTGVSVIDGITTLVRGQKLPIFTGHGLPHNQLAAQIVTQGKVKTNEDFLIIFVGIGILQDDAIFFQKVFKESGNFQNIISFINLAIDPAIERILIPRVALTTAEYFAYDLNMHVLVVLTDMTNYCEALRELSTAKEEIPGRKGFPGYLYSDLASIYERAGRIKGKKGSITQIPIISMPNDDITHPIPDLTGYITEGQIVFSRDLFKRGIYPPIDILSSLSRLMKDSIGEGTTREDHQDVMNQVFDFYSKSLEIKELESIIGEESLSKNDQYILEFGKEFENKFIKQRVDEDRSIKDSLDIVWKILSKIPKDQLIRIKSKFIEKYYKS
jgi:V/A-type H+/Na+-transporting ATPase subunit B